MPDISHLKNLVRLNVSWCPCLIEIPGLGKLTHLQHLGIDYCDSLRKLEKPQNLKEPIKVHFIGCDKLSRRSYREWKVPTTIAMGIDTGEEEANILESILVSGCLDFVITNGRANVQVSDLLGKSVLLYFSTYQSPSCYALFLKLVEAYHEKKAKDEAFEVIFIPFVHDRVAFKKYFSRMPWLALPFDDPRILSLFSKLEIHDIPKLVALGPRGQIITEEGRSLLEAYGADAYPFTDDHIEDMVNSWPEKLPHALHCHELQLTPWVHYTCDGCQEMGSV
ncbi:probable nucleoredoxin 1 [Punica granatum]|uniref:protein-disulfide reductase n=1 Tax=Punica granatum TaxID=22663 RepID=A0A6P8CIT7_PUNGR|nr:probable nucleoredoxin 1 [Punica granatum]